MKKFALLAALALTTAMPANAAVITQTFDLFANAFAPGGGPYSTVSGRFTVTFDNSADISRTTSGIIASDFTLPSNYLVGFSYNRSQDLLVIGSDTGNNSCTISANKFCFLVSNASTTLADMNVNNNFYYVPDNSRPYASQRTIARVTASVPEPTTWAMMMLGFGVLGFALRRKTKVQACIRFA